MNIFVGNLPYSISEQELRREFEAFGQVDSVRVIKDRETGKSKGFGFVEMPDDAAAQKAIAELDGGMVEGRAIRVSVAKPREERSSNGGGNFGGNRRSFSGSNNNRW